MTLTSADRAWITLGVGVFMYDCLCDEGCTLSERVDDWIIARPTLTKVVIALVAAHLMNLLSPRFDIIHVSFVGLRQGRMWCMERAQLRDARATIASRRACVISTASGCIDTAR